MLVMTFPSAVMARPRLNRATLHTRVNPETLETLKRIAISLNLTYTKNTGDKGASIGELIDIIVRDFSLLERLKQSSSFPVDNIKENR